MKKGRGLAGGGESPAKSSETAGAATDTAAQSDRLRSQPQPHRETVQGKQQHRNLDSHELRRGTLGGRLWRKALG